MSQSLKADSSTENCLTISTFFFRLVAGFGMPFSWRVTKLLTLPREMPTGSEFLRDKTAPEQVRLVRRAGEIDRLFSGAFQMFCVINLIDRFSVTHRLAHLF